MEPPRVNFAEEKKESDGEQYVAEEGDIHSSSESGVPSDEDDDGEVCHLSFIVDMSIAVVKPEVSQTH